MGFLAGTKVHAYFSSYMLLPLPLTKVPAVQLESVPGCYTVAAAAHCTRVVRMGQMQRTDFNKGISKNISKKYNNRRA